jgi:hypothetical protein
LDVSLPYEQRALLALLYRAGGGLRAFMALARSRQWWFSFGKKKFLNQTID